MMCSNPELSSLRPHNVKFKAKPIPKNLFSNYAYERMKEEDFYRAIKKRIRAEEMLKSASLPPSMALREGQYRSKSLDYLECCTSERHWHETCAHRLGSKDIKKDLESEEEKERDLIDRKNTWLSKSRKRMNSMTDSSTEISPYESAVEGVCRRKVRPHSAFIGSRNNLASSLRLETTRYVDPPLETRSLVCQGSTPPMALKRVARFAKSSY